MNNDDHNYIGNWMVNNHIISEEQRLLALNEQKKNRKKLWSYLD